MRIIRRRRRGRRRTTTIPIRTPATTQTIKTRPITETMASIIVGTITT